MLPRKAPAKAAYCMLWTHEPKKTSLRGTFALQRSRSTEKVSAAWGGAVSGAPLVSLTAADYLRANQCHQDRIALHEKAVALGEAEPSADVWSDYADFLLRVGKVGKVRWPL